MANLLPTNFPTPTETAVLSYPYADIAEGTGNVFYYPCRVSIDNNTANDVYILATSTSIVPSATYTTVAGGVTVDWDYDVTFNAPKIIDGDAIFITPLYANGGGAGSSIVSQITVIQYDGSTETTLVAKTSAPQLNVAAGGGYGEFTLKVNIPRTKFRVGDTLRITQELTTQNDTGQVYHDPTASDTTNFPLTGGRFTAVIPFRLTL